MGSYPIIVSIPDPPSPSIVSEGMMLLLLLLLVLVVCMMCVWWVLLLLSCSCPC